MERFQSQNLANTQKALQNIKGINCPSLDAQIYLSKPLSVRECEILHLSAKGLSNAEIAALLSISRHTVKSHFDHIFNKLGAANRVTAVVWAIRNGLI